MTGPGGARTGEGHALAQALSGRRNVDLLGRHRYQRPEARQGGVDQAAIGNRKYQAISLALYPSRAARAVTDRRRDVPGFCAGWDCPSPSACYRAGPLLRAVPYYYGDYGHRRQACQICLCFSWNSANTPLVQLMTNRRPKPKSDFIYTRFSKNSKSPSGVFFDSSSVSPELFT
jgi:hypothetical protein